MLTQWPHIQDQSLKRGGYPFFIGQACWSGGRGSRPFFDPISLISCEKVRSVTAHLPPPCMTPCAHAATRSGAPYGVSFFLVPSLLSLSMRQPGQREPISKRVGKARWMD